MKQCLENQTLKQDSISKSWDYCIHTVAAQKFGPKQNMENAELRESQTEVDVNILSKNPNITDCYSLWNRKSQLVEELKKTEKKTNGRHNKYFC